VRFQLKSLLRLIQHFINGARADFLLLEPPLHPRVRGSRATIAGGWNHDRETLDASVTAAVEEVAGVVLNRCPILALARERENLEDSRLRVAVLDDDVEQDVIDVLSELG